MPTLNELNRQRNNVLADASALLARGLKSSDSKRNFESLLTQADRLGKDISMIERAERLGADAASRAAVENASQSPEIRRAKLNAAFRDVVRNGHSFDRPEQRDLTTTSGGAVIPVEFESNFAEAQKWFGPVASMVHVKDLEKTGRSTKLPVSDDTASTMTYLAEDGSTSGIELDPVLFSNIPAGTDTLVSTVIFSRQEAIDASDFGDYISRIAGIRISRAIEYAVLKAKDNGTNTALPNSPAGGLLAAVSAGVTMSSGTLSTGPVYANMAGLAASVDHAYRVNASFLVSQNVHDFLVAAVDTTGRPLYMFNDDGNLVVAGRPVEVASNAAMAAYNAASSPIALFGDFSRAYALIQGPKTIRILTERYADQNLIAAVIYTRIAGAALVSGAVKSLVSAGS